VVRPPLEVRRAEPDDVEDLLVLWDQARQELPWRARALTGTTPEELRSRLGAALAGAELDVLVARVDGRPAGYLVYRSAPVLPLVDVLAVHVEHLYVVSAERRRGVARGLLAAVAALAERSGAEQVVCNVAPSARDAHRFLARLGFSPLTFRRAVTTSTLRRRLTGDQRRPALEDLLSLRRSQRALRRMFPGTERTAGAGEPEPVLPAAAATGSVAVTTRSVAVTTGPVKVTTGPVTATAQATTSPPTGPVSLPVQASQPAMGPGLPSVQAP